MARFISRRDRSIAEHLEKIVADMHDIKEKDLFVQDRRSENTVPRFILWWILHNSYDWSCTMIARRYKRDHSTIVSGWRQVETLNLGEEIRLIHKEVVHRVGVL